MKQNYKASRLLVLIVILISIMPAKRILAQENSNVTEPPIPVYFVYPNHDDSLRAAYENSFLSNGSALVYINKKYDTLQIQIQKSSAENIAHFTWLYALVALLGTMNIVLLFSTSRIRKELSMMKRLEHQQKLTVSGPDNALQISNQTQDTLSNQVPAEAHKSVRSGKTRVKKSHI